MPSRARRQVKADVPPCDFCPPAGQRCTSTRACAMMAGYREAQLKMRLHQCCTETSEDKCAVINRHLNDLVVKLVTMHFTTLALSQ